jgi:hypothetical protein
METVTAEGLARVFTRNAPRAALDSIDDSYLGFLEPVFDNLRATGHAYGEA